MSRADRLETKSRLYTGIIIEDFSQPLTERTPMNILPMKNVPPTATNWRLVGIQCFVIFHIIVLVCCGVPGSFPLKDRLLQVLNPYALRVGLWQYWNMFAPEPFSLNAYLEAEIEFADGTKSVWSFPQMSKMGYFERMCSERYRKWAVDEIRLDEKSLFWADTARYVARKAQTDPSNPPHIVSLRRHWHVIEDPNLAFVPVGSRVLASRFQTYRFYRYEVHAEDVL